MSHQAQPHLVYLERLFDETIAAAGLPPRSFETDERGMLTAQYDEAQQTAFRDYFEYVSRETSHFEDVYAEYRERHDQRLWEPNNTRLKPVNIWTLAAVAVGELHLSTAVGDIRGGTNDDIQELRIVRGPHNSHISIPLTLFIRYGLVDYQEDSTVLRTSNNGTVRPALRYRTATPQGGEGPKLPSRARAGRIGLRPALGNS